ncbi:hypothetical protein [Thermoactinomyces sp. DSM 45892]|uniref:hypothetical protein n=1 Tax=Thermoactinomyces sp. DSM 45892 TaxID=1882753 RepID=UPI000899F916|nr:hypothetical protein [Thermoactinomyces sp. DSM 45892]SDY79058.1 hypothetical protein SAMN05444416_108101 [Thermoactinomyces sp. DSM 45892]
MDEYKSILNKILEAVQIHHAKFDSLELRMARLEGKIDGLEMRLTSVEERLTNVEERLTNVEERLTNVEERLTNVEERLTDVEESVRILKGEFGEHQLRLERHEVSQQILAQKIFAHDTDILHMKKRFFA